MKRHLILLTALSAVGLAGCGSSDSPAIPEGTTVTLALMETTDIHANVMSYN
jgi:2',3'-cyclic-nucleotide 2'-phosphodiesterase/3'-nucleotidase